MLPLGLFLLRGKIASNPKCPFVRLRRFSSGPNAESTKDSQSCEIFRHDKFLKPEKKVYTRTWNECEDFFKDVWRCVGENLPPETEKRDRRKQGSTKGKSSCRACEGDEFRLGLMKCRPPMKTACGGAVKKSCAIYRESVCCQKRCTQYPSYSECKQPTPEIEKPTECICKKHLSPCEMYEKFRAHAQK